MAAEPKLEPPVVPTVPVAKLKFAEQIPEPPEYNLIKLYPAGLAKTENVIGPVRDILFW